MEKGLTTKEQREWIEAMKEVFRVKPIRRSPRPDNDLLRALCWDIAGSLWFEKFILLVIVFNTLLMGLDGYGIPESQAERGQRCKLVTRSRAVGESSRQK